MRRFLHPAVAVLSYLMLSSLALADPSSRVGRLSAVEGQVSFRSNSQAGAEAASLNWPVTSRNQMSTSRNGRVELRIGSSIVQLNGDSELEVLALDDDEFRLRLNYGSLYLTVKNPEVARELKISTPHGSLRLEQPSRLRLDTEVTPDITALAVVSGAAQFDGMAANLKITAGKRIEINDSSTRLVAARVDAFDDWSASRERLTAGDGRAESARYVSSETTGHEELDRHGDWRVVEDFGPVWTPRNVAADWAPYRDGRWTWIEPWGWTWVDNAPWGYAPSHYGRWVSLDMRWYWVPGRMAVRPVWAPAMVGWVGGATWSMSVGGRAAPGASWFPLAPREVYVPAYRVSSTYVERINHAHGAGMSPPSHYRNARVALTVGSQGQFAARGNNVVTATAQPSALTESGSRQPAELQGHGRGTAAPDGRYGSRVQERPMPPVPQAQPQGALQAAPPPRPQAENPAMQQTVPQPAPRAMEAAREPQERGRGQPPQQQVMQQPPQQQAMPQGGSRDREQDRERGRGQPPQQQVMQQPPQQQATPQGGSRDREQDRERGRGQPPQQQVMQQPSQQQATPQGGSRDREQDRERAAARQERRQQGDRETGSMLR